jgi:hypothetical protein
MTKELIVASMGMAFFIICPRMAGIETLVIAIFVIIGVKVAPFVAASVYQLFA